jgi:hypothetical protein
MEQRKLVEGCSLELHETGQSQYSKKPMCWGEQGFEDAEPSQNPQKIEGKAVMMAPPFLKPIKDINVLTFVWDFPMKIVNWWLFVFKAHLHT